MMQPYRQLRTLMALRGEAARLLAGIAEEHGAGSRLHRVCSKLWRAREADACAAVRYGDLENAVVVLQRAVELLTLGPTVLTRHELDLDDLEWLLLAA